VWRRISLVHLHRLASVSDQPASLPPCPPTYIIPASTLPKGPTSPADPTTLFAAEARPKPVHRGYDTELPGTGGLRSHRLPSQAGRLQQERRSPRAEFSTSPLFHRATRAVRWLGNPPSPLAATTALMKSTIPYPPRHIPRAVAMWNAWLTVWLGPPSSPPRSRAPLA